MRGVGGYVNARRKKFSFLFRTGADATHGGFARFPRESVAPSVA